MRRCLAVVLWLCASTVYALPVVPGAPNSPGMDTRAAYCGGTNPTVYRVTKLADDGTSGTLRTAMEASGNRVVIFEISGEIVLQGSDIVVTSPCMTVAGQTAPSPGITVRHWGIQLNAHDILLQHFRIRRGQSSGDITCGNNLEIWGNNAYNIVVDHMSTSWGQDEGIVVLNTSRDSNTVIWRSIMSEGLYFTYGTGPNEQYPGSPACGGGGASGGHGLLVYVETKGVTVAQSVFAKNHERNPNVQGGTSLVFLNNLIYGWRGLEGVLFVNFDGGGGFGNIWKASVVGNRFIASAATPQNDDLSPGSAYRFVYSANGGSPSGNEIYRSDNTIANPNGSISDEGNFLSYNPNVGSPPTLAPLPSGYSALASTAVEANANANAGARPVDRDSVDTRIFSEITARASSVAFIEFPADVGGWPTLAANTRPLTPPSNPNGDDDADGYTNLEEWLQSYSALVESPDAAPPGPADVTPAGGTVFVSANFTGTAATPLTSYTSGTGGGWALQAGSTGVLAIDSANRVMATSVQTGSLTLAAGSPISAQYDVDWDWVVLSIIPDNSYSVWLHAIPNLFTGIFFAYDTTGSTGTLGYFIDGGLTVLGTCSVSLSVGTHHGTFRVRNATRHVILDGVQCTSATDGTLPAMGQAGLSAFHTTADTNTTGIHVDNFIVTDVATSTPPATVTKLRLRFK